MTQLECCPLALLTDYLQHIYTNSPYYLNMEELWTNWPQRELTGLVKAYILGQWAFWIQQVLVINMEDRRKDHWQMLSHHFVTIALISASYAYHQTRVGNLILVLMDVVDLIFPVSCHEPSTNKSSRTNGEFSLPSASNTSATARFVTSCLASLSFCGSSRDTYST